MLSAMTCLSAMAAEVTNTVPADGSTVSSLKSVAFEIDGYIFGTMSNASYSVKDQDGNTYACKLSSTWSLIESNYVYAGLVTLDERIYTAGTYTVTVDENAFYCDRWQTVFTPTMTATITVDGTGSAEGAQDAVTTTPANGASVGGIDGFSITFTDHTSLSGTAKVEVIDSQNRVVASANGGTITENTIEFNTNEVVTLPGTYTVRMGADQLYFDGNKYEPSNTVITFEVVVTGDYQFDNVEFSLEDYAELKEFKELTITYTDYETIKLPGYGSYLYILDAEGNQTNSSMYVSSYAINGNSLSLSLYTAFDTPGEYSIAIPKGFFLLGENERPCTPQAFHFTILEPEPDNVTADPADGSELTALEQITLTFNDATEVAAAGQWSYVATVAAAGGGYRLYCLGKNVTCEGNTVTIPLTVVEGQEPQVGEEITVNIGKGTIILNTPEGQFSNQLLQLHYTIVDQTTAIDAVKAIERGEIFDLQGRKVSSMKAGQIYLQQGRATIAK